MFDSVFKIKPNELCQANNTFFLSFFDQFLNRIKKYFKVLFIFEDILVIDVDQCSDCINSKVMIFVITPFCQLCKLLQRSVWVLQYLLCHQTDFIFLCTSTSYYTLPFVLLFLADLIVFTLSHRVQLIDRMTLEINFIISLFFVELFSVVVVPHYYILLQLQYRIIFDC